MLASEIQEGQATEAKAIDEARPLIYSATTLGKAASAKVAKLDSKD